MEGQEISMKSEIVIWHITFGVLMKNTNLSVQMNFHAENDVTFDLFVPSIFRPSSHLAHESLKTSFHL